MATKIEWTQETWNPVRGCSRVSPGCDHCYAMRQAHRMNHHGGAYEGLTRNREVRPGWRHPRTIDWSGNVRFVEAKLGDPLQWRKPRHVFVNSMGDLFHEKLSNDQIAAVFGVMAACPQHTFQVLTKRSERMVEWFAWVDEHGMPQGRIHAAVGPYLCDAYGIPRTPQPMEAFEESDAASERICDAEWPLPNVMLGVTAENQAMADERIPLLLQVPAAVRFVSVEPMLEAVVLPCACGEDPLGHQRACPWNCFGFKSEGIDWIIAGCESGPGARPAEADWFRSLRDQCVEAGVPYFLKQMHIDGRLVKMPELDGRVWDQVPQPNGAPQ